MSNNPEEWPDADFTPPPPSQIRLRGDKIRRGPRTAALIAGGVVVGVAAASVGAVALLNPKPKNPVLDPGASPTASSSAIATPAPTPSTSSTPASTSSVSPSTSNATTPTKACLVEPNASWKSALSESGPFVSDDVSRDIGVLEDGSVLTTKNLNPKAAVGQGPGPQAIVRYPSTKGGTAQELVRVETGTKHIFGTSKWLIWAGFDPMGGGNGLSIKPMAGGDTVKITDDHFVGNPRLTQGTIRWVNFQEGKSVLRQYDLTSKKITDLATLPATSSAVDMFDNYVVVRENNRLLMFTTAGKKVDIIDDATSMRPVLGSGERQWYIVQHNKLIRWSMDDGSEVTIPTPKTPEFAFKAIGNYVLWQTKDFQSYITDVRTGAAIPFSAGKSSSTPKGGPLQLNDGHVFPSGIALQDLPGLTCN